MPRLMSGDWKRSTVSGPQRLQLDAWTAPDLSATAPALDSTAYLTPEINEALPSDPTRPEQAYPGRGLRGCGDGTLVSESARSSSRASQGVFRLA